MKKQTGFTLMELLIVIGVLGILASGLLAAIDPFEQLKKARDANNRNASIELLGAFTRYYATHGEFPWNLETPIDCDGDGTADKPKELATDSLEINEMPACITALESDGELKSDFVKNVKAKVYVASDPSDKTDLHVCFAPEGKALRTDALTRWHVDAASPYNIVEDTDGGATAADCPNVDSSSCLQCFE